MKSHVLDYAALTVALPVNEDHVRFGLVVTKKYSFHKGCSDGLKGCPKFGRCG